MGSRRTIWAVAGLLALLFVALGVLPTRAAPPAASRTFPQTGQTVQGAFLTFFDQRGGVPLFGYPLTGERLENGLTVQYFQRARFEWHPNNPAAYRVQLGLLGQQRHGPATARVAPLPSGAAPVMRYFPETGHNVTNAFLDFWSRQGGVDLFGYPLGEAYVQGGVTFQWFQRARFEYRNGRLELGLLGSEWLESGTASPPPASPPPSTLPTDQLRRRQFLETGQSVQGGFLAFWEARGGQARFGLPISGEFMEGGRSVQYFEFARFEWHPTNPPASRVLLGLLGQELYGPPAPAAPRVGAPGDANIRYFPETGHTVSNAFLRAFDQQGGLELFGYPLTEAMQEGDAIVQWFQRRKLRFAAGAVSEVPLGRARFNPDNEGRFPPQQLFLLYLQSNLVVRDRLGAGLEDAKNPTIAWQPFEGGELVWRSDTNQIVALFATGAWQIYDNPWRAGDAISGGLTPPAGRVEPVLGLGAVWRALGGASGPLGWATAPQGDGIGTAQRFQFGTLLYNPVNQRLYTLFANEGWSSMENPWPDFAP